MDIVNLKKVEKKLNKLPIRIKDKLLTCATSSSQCNTSEVDIRSYSMTYSSTNAMEKKELSPLGGRVA